MLSSKSFDVDCHVLVKDDEEAGVALNMLSDHPVNIHISGAIEGDIKQARNIAYRLGDAEYVSFIDPDDIVLPNSYASCLDLINKNPDLIGCYTSTRMRHGKSETVRHLENWTPLTFIDLGWNRTFIVRQDVLLFVLDNWYEMIPNIWGTDRAILSLTSLLGDWDNIKTEGYIHQLTDSSVTIQMQKKHGIQHFYDRLTPVKHFILDNLDKYKQAN